MTRKKPDLRFGPGSSGGFTPAGIAAFDNLRPAAVVRELIQNGLDAARNAGVRPAVVTFRLERRPLASIPGIESYRGAFGKAVERQREMAEGSLPGQAELVVQRMTEALGSEELDFLTVLDNGIGLNEQRMNALLSDGVSVKPGGATGTYGNGHSTAIPVSDLRYVLYGGVSDGGQRIGSGHAVLASHVQAGDRHLRGGDGFYIRDFAAGRGTLYEYASNEQLPELIEEALADVRNSWGRGTAVIIPAFNNFMEEETLWEMVSHAASANFFVAIDDGDLEVVVEDRRPGADSEKRVVDKARLGAVLRSHREKQRARAFLNGKRAFEGYDAYRRGERRTVTTSAGKIGVSLKKDVKGVTRVDLFRNGMWVSDRIPRFYQKFADRVPFHAVLSLDAEEGGDLYDWIRIAEGPLHDAIVVKRLPRDRRTACYRALGEVVDWLRANVDAVSSEEYMSPDFLTLDFGDEEGSGTGRVRKGRFWGAPVPVGRAPARQVPLFRADRDSDETEEREERQRRSRRERDRERRHDRRRQRPSLPRFFQAASCPTGESRRRIVVECARDYANAELRLVVDEALDATCERHGQDGYAPAVLSRVTVDGRAVEGSELVRWDGKVVGIRLGDLVAGRSVEVETNYRLDGEFADMLTPSLRVEVFAGEKDES